MSTLPLHSPASPSAAGPSAAVSGSATLLPLEPALDAPLPDAIAGRDHGWLTVYRRYPVFSPAWARGRALRLGLFA